MAAAYVSSDTSPVFYLESDFIGPVQWSRNATLELQGSGGYLLDDSCCSIDLAKGTGTGASFNELSV